MAIRNFFAALFLAGGISLGALRGAAQKQESPVFRIEVEMVLLNVAVTDGKGNYVTGLKPSDFEIYEDGVLQKLATFAEGNEIPQKLADFDAARSQPRLLRPSAGRPPQQQDEEGLVTPVAGASVFILFDTSNSMYRGFVYAQEAISEFVRSLDPPDRVAFYSFSRNIKRAALITADRQQILRAVRNTVAGDEIALYNALVVTLRDAAQLSGRKMVVVFSNGPDNSSMVAPEHVRELAQAEGIPIYVICTQEAKQDPVSAAVLERLSSSSGGKVYFAKNWKEQQKAFNLIREDLGHLYVLSYYPQPNPNNGWRKITAKLVGERLEKYRTRTRFGYRPKRTQVPEQTSGNHDLVREAVPVR